MAERSSTDDVLDAIEDSILAVGVRRTTFSDVARRAGLSRPTLYTHFPDVNAGIAALMTREFAALVGQVATGVTDVPDERRRLVEILVRVARELPHQPLFERILDVDPDLLLPYVFDRLGSSQRQALDVVGQVLAAGQQQGSIRDGDPGVMALTVLLTVQSFVLSNRIVAAEQGLEPVLAELRHLLDGGLAPAPSSGDHRFAEHDPSRPAPAPTEEISL